MDLSGADRAIIDVLREGARTQAYIVDETGYSRQHVYNRLQVLQAGGIVERIHDRSALYELANDPQDEDVQVGEGEPNGDENGQ